MKCIKSYNWFQTFFTTKTCPLLWKYMFIIWTWWKTKLYKNFKVFKFWRKGCKEKDFFFKPFDKTIVFNRFKMSSLRCRSHVQEKILPNNMFGCPLKLIFGISRIFFVFGYKPKYSYTIMYECKNSQSPHELS